MKFTALTIFPEMFAPLQESILKRAQEADYIRIELVNFREYAQTKHKNVDDVPYGGGNGMLLKPEPVFRALAALEKTAGRRRIILLSPQGAVFNQKCAARLASYDEIVFLCGHYEGFDERIRDLADEEISIGDYVLTGGELAAMVIIDAVSRLIPGVLGKQSSSEHDSHEDGLLEYPQYTRPREFAGKRVPEILFSGHHHNIEQWRRKEALRRTFLRRSDLFAQIVFQPEDYALLEELAIEHPELAACKSSWEHLKPVAKRNGKKLNGLKNPGEK